MFLLSYQFSFAQNDCKLTLRGKVLGSKDSAAVSHAEIFIESAHRHVSSDANGFFRLDNLCKGDILVEVDKAGYTHHHQEIYLKYDTVITIFLELKNQAFDTIHVHATNEKSQPLTIGSNAILNRNGSDLSQILTEIPGIEILQGGKNQSKPMVRGFYGLRAPIISGETKLEGQQWGNDHNPEADAQSFDQIELIKDASMLKYSHEGFGGIIHIYSKPDAHEGEMNVDQSFQAGSNGRQFAYSTRIIQKAAKEKPTYFGGAAIRRAGNYSTPDIFLDNTGLMEFSANAGVMVERGNKTNKWHFGSYRYEGGIFPGSRAGSVPDMLAAIDRKIPLSRDAFNYKIESPRQVAGHITLQTEKTIRKNKSLHTIQAGLQYDQRREFDYHRSSRFRFPQLDLVLFTPSLSYSVIRYLTKNRSLSYGIQSQMNINRFGGFYFLPDFTGSSTGSYAVYHLHSRHVTHTFSGRADGKIMIAKVREAGVFRDEMRQFLNYSAAYSGLIERKRHQILWHVSRLWRAPWFNELFTSGVHHGSASFEKGNANLKQEISHRAEVEWNYKSKLLQFYISPYISHIQGFINLSPDKTPVITVRGVFPGYTYRQADALFAAADGQLKTQITNWLEWSLRGSFIYAVYTASREYPAFIPQSRIRQFINFKYHQWTLQYHFEHVFKQKFYTNGTDFIPPPDAYGLNGFEITNNNADGKSRIEAAIGVSNLFNIRYRTYTDRFRYFMDMPGRNIQLKIIWHFHHHHQKHYQPN